jgi:hypothetical protein
MTEMGYYYFLVSSRAKQVDSTVPNKTEVVKPVLRMVSLVMTAACLKVNVIPVPKHLMSALSYRQHFHRFDQNFYRFLYFVLQRYYGARDVSS